MELRNNSAVRVFRRAAIAHEEAARLLLSHCSKGESSTLCGEVIYLSGYVAECALKAVAFSWTPDKQHSKLEASFKTPKGPGHDLEKLRSLLIRKGCPVPTAVREVVALLSTRWYTQMRYSGRSYRYDEAAAIQAATGQILDWIREDVR